MADTQLRKNTIKWLCQIASELQRQNQALQKENANLRDHLKRNHNSEITKQKTFSAKI